MRLFKAFKKKPKDESNEKAKISNEDFIFEKIKNFPSQALVAISARCFRRLEPVFNDIGYSRGFKSLDEVEKFVGYNTKNAETIAIYFKKLENNSPEWISYSSGLLASMMELFIIVEELKMGKKEIDPNLVVGLVLSTFKFSSSILEEKSFSDFTQSFIIDCDMINSFNEDDNLSLEILNKLWWN